MRFNIKTKTLSIPVVLSLALPLAALVSHNPYRVATPPYAKECPFNIKAGSANIAQRWASKPMPCSDANVITNDSYQKFDEYTPNADEWRNGRVVKKGFPLRYKNATYTCYGISNYNLNPKAFVITVACNHNLTKVAYYWAILDN